MSDQNKKNKKKSSLKNRLLSFEQTDKIKMDVDFDEGDLENAFDQIIEPQNAENLTFTEDTPNSDINAPDEEDSIEIGLSNVSMDDLNFVLKEYDQKTADEKKGETRIDLPYKESKPNITSDQIDISVSNILDEYDKKTSHPPEKESIIVEEDFSQDSPEADFSFENSNNTQQVPEETNRFDSISSIFDLSADEEEETTAEEELALIADEEPGYTSELPKSPTSNFQAQKEPPSLPSNILPKKSRKRKKATTTKIPDARIQELKDYFIVFVNKNLQIAESYQNKKSSEKIKTSSTEDNYLQMIWAGKNEEPPSNFSVFFNMKAFKLFALKAEIEKAFKGKYENQRKVLLLTDKMNKLMEYLSVKEREEFTTSLLQPLTSIVLIRGIGYLNIILDKLKKMKDTIHAFDFIRTIIAIQSIQQKDISLYKEFELSSYICLFLAEIKEKKNDKSHNAVTTLFSGKGSRRVNFSSYVQGSAVQKILDVMSELDVERNLPHLLWARSQLFSMAMEEKVTFLQNFAIGLTAIRNTLWKFFERIGISDIGIQQNFLNKFINHFKNVPVQYWQLIGNKKVEESIFGIFSLLLQHTPLYTDNMLHIVCDISKPQDIDNWRIVYDLLKTLGNMEIEENLILNAVNRYLGEKNIPIISLDEKEMGIIDTMFELVSKSPDEAPKAKQIIQEKEETMLLREFIMVTKLDQLDPPTFIAKFMESFIEYIGSMDEPISEIYLISKIITRKWRHGDKRLKILMGIGAYIEKEFKFFNLSDPISRIEFKEKIADVLLEILDSLSEESLKEFLQKDEYSSDSTSILDELLVLFCRHITPIQDLKKLYEQLQQQEEEAQKLLLLRVTLAVELALEDDIKDIKSQNLDIIRQKCLDITQLMDSKEMDLFVKKTLTSLVSSALPPDNLSDKLTAIHNNIKQIKNSKVIQRFLETIAPVCLQTFNTDIDLLTDTLQWASNVYQKSPISMEILHITEDKIKEQLGLSATQTEKVWSIINAFRNFLGFSHKEIDGLSGSLNKLLIQNAELEMYQFLEDIHSYRKTRTEKKLLGELNNTFITKALPEILTTIHRHPQIIYFFQDAIDVTNYYKATKDILYAEGLTSYSRNHKNISECLTIQIFKDIVPAIVEASEGHLKIVQTVLETILGTIRRDIVSPNLRLIFLRGCSEQLKKYSLQNNLKKIHNLLTQYSNDLPYSDILSHLLERAMPYDKKFDASPKLSKLKSLVEHEKEKILDRQSIDTELKSKFHKLFGKFFPDEATQEKTRYLLIEILFMVFQSEDIKKMITQINIKDNYFNEWRDYLKGKATFVRWVRFMEDGGINNEIDWMYNTAWYRDVAQNYWSNQESSNKITGLFKSLVKDFEKIENKREILKKNFIQWEDENLGFIGKFLLRAFIYKDGPLEPLKLIHHTMERIKSYRLGTQDIRMVFLKKAINSMKNLEEVGITLRTEKENVKTLQEDFEDTLIKKLNERTLQHFTNDLLKEMPKELNQTVKARLTHRMRTIPAPPEGSEDTHLDYVISYLIDNSAVFSFVEVLLATLNNPNLEKLLRGKYTRTSKIFSHHSAKKELAYDTNILLTTAIEDTKYILSKNQKITNKDAIFIKRNFPSFYFDYMDYITLMLQWRENPETEMLVETIESLEGLKVKVSKDKELLYLISRNKGESKVNGLLRAHYEDSNILKRKLKTLLKPKAKKQKSDI